MAFKLKKLADFVNPSPSDYDPNTTFTKPTSQRVINYDSNRADFSKSITGARIGPGLYENQRKDSFSLGKMGKSAKFDPNKNVNVMFMRCSLDLGHTKSLQESANFLNIALVPRSSLKPDFPVLNLTDRSV